MLTPDSTSKNLIVRRPLVMYFVFSYVFFWLFLALFGGIVIGLLKLEINTLPGWVMPLVQITGSWMPNLAALIVTGVGEGREGIARLFGKFVQFKLPVRWYLAALIPLTVAFALGGIYQLAGGVPAAAGSLTLNFWVGLIVINFLTGATGEEAGWRGFALPRLLERYSPLKAGLVLGVIWDLWHLPLWLTMGLDGQELLIYCVSFSLAIISFSTVMTWIYCHTSNSLVPMVVLHFFFNAATQLVSPNGFGLVPELPLIVFSAGAYVVVAIAVWALGGLSVRKTLTFNPRSA